MKTKEVVLLSLISLQDEKNKRKYEDRKNKRKYEDKRAQYDHVEHMGMIAHVEVLKKIRCNEKKRLYSAISITVVMVMMLIIISTIPDSEKAVVFEKLIDLFSKLATYLLHE